MVGGLGCGEEEEGMVGSGAMVLDGHGISKSH